MSLPHLLAGLSKQVLYLCKMILILGLATPKHAAWHASENRGVGKLFFPLLTQAEMSKEYKQFVQYIHRRLLLCLFLSCSLLSTQFCTHTHP